jgi:hypothetical protein
VQEAPQHARGQGIKVGVEVPHHQRLHIYFFFIIGFCFLYLPTILFEFPTIMI